MIPLSSPAISYRPYLIPVIFASLTITCKFIFESGGLASLIWILKPLAALVSVLTGSSFVYDPVLGYVNESGTITLGVTCSGINFMIITLLLSLFTFLPRFTFRNQLLYGMVLLFLSWLFALIVNASRIAVSIRLLQYEDQFPSLGAEKVHEATGILYFLLTLMIYYFFLKKIISKLYIV